MALIHKMKLLGLAAGLLPLGVRAQQATLEEIVVTAQKRSEKSQSVSANLEASR